MMRRELPARGGSGRRAPAPVAALWGEAGGAGAEPRRGAGGRQSGQPLAELRGRALEKPGEVGRGEAGQCASRQSQTSRRTSAISTSG